MWGLLLAAVLVIGVIAWRARRRSSHWQYVKLTEKRQAELLDVQRRQHERR
jgi:cytochrome c-type biogenesis protein CcmH/NrfF